MMDAAGRVLDLDPREIEPLMTAVVTAQATGQVQPEARNEKLDGGEQRSRPGATFNAGAEDLVVVALLVVRRGGLRRRGGNNIYDSVQ